jgi:S1-C subfamily serine protease
MPGVSKTIATSVIAAVLGGGVTAGVLLGAGVVDGGETTTVIQQAPLAATGRTVSDGKSLTAREIYKRDAPGVVFIRARVVQQSASPFDFGTPQEGESTGSGFVIDEEGNILTNAHVVEGATDISVTFGDERLAEAKVVGKDESTDLALIKVEPKGLDLRPLELGDSKTIQVGDPTIAIGNPFGFDRTLTTGVVSALQRQIQAPDGYTIENVIQTDAAINPGNSGGPLLDAAGRVIGINSQIATGGAGNGSVGIGFAVPIETAKRVIPQLKESGRVERAWLGLEYVAIDESLSALNLEEKQGLLVQQVVPDGPADKAGLVGGDDIITLNGNPIALGGDIVTHIAGTPMKTTEDVRKLLETKKPGDRIDLQVLQAGGDKRTVKVTLGNRPAGRTG